ncbi:hypothetical protein [Aliarcobacter cryaerophilus]|uniref:hypothetical protein n=1 Tax=Aliarcobacter cryaerophilus TaxID=28198 RepID=UPI003DA51C26
MKKVLLILTFSLVNSFAYDVDKEGKWWYIYNGNDVVGAYTDYYGNGYKMSCGDPNKSVYDNKYINKLGQTYIMDNVTTERVAKNTIISNCVKR